MSSWVWLPVYLALRGRKRALVYNGGVGAMRTAAENDAVGKAHRFVEAGDIRYCAE